MAKITSPVEGYEGVVAGVRFEDGQGDTDNEGALAYFHAAGYTVDGGDDSFTLDSDAAPYMENPGGALGNVVENPKGPIDAADPDNDLVPVGGVKSAAAPGAPTPRTRGKRAANTTDKPADITPRVPVSAGGTPENPDGSLQHADSATTATTPSAAPVGDQTAGDYSSATPAPDPTAQPVVENTTKDAAVQLEKDTTSDASAPEDSKGGEQTPTGASAAAANTQKAKG